MHENTKKIRFSPVIYHLSQLFRADTTEIDKTKSRVHTHTHINMTFNVSHRTLAEWDTASSVNNLTSKFFFDLTLT